MEEMMKKIYLFLACLVAFSCVTDHGEEIQGKRTRAAYRVFDYARRVVDSQMEILYLAKHLDLYINAPTDEEKIQIEDRYFKNSKIRKIEGVYRIYDATSAWEINTGDRKLTDMGALWKISNSEEEGFRIVRCAITCSGDHQWKMSLEARRFTDEGSSCTYEVSEKEGDYFIGGVGEFVDEGSLVEYKIIDPVLFSQSNRPYSLSKGKMEMTLAKLNSSVGEPMLIDLTLLGKVKITYRGITEIW